MWRLGAAALAAIVGLAGGRAAAADPPAGRSPAAGEGPVLVYEGKGGPCKGRHAVFIVGDDEYRSEELMPQLARILAAHHGLRCTVLFALAKQTGEIDPATQDNIPGLEALAGADLMVMFLRFRELPDEQMKHIIDYTDSGRPIMALRTSTHAFNYKRKDSPYARYTFRGGTLEGGYGRQVLGETWINHYGQHQKESTRGIPAPGAENHPILRGADDVWGPSDVYAVTTLAGDCKPILLGQVLKGMDPKDPPNPDKKPVPVAWTKTYTGAQGKAARVFTTTMGHVGDLQSEGFRRILVNAAYWCLGMEAQIPAKAKVDFVGQYSPSPIGMGKFKKGVKPADLRLP
ncbi:MAG: ThuA domain-containing protein [Planctomycetes bacterium]|nr:ThuA domain-containing protein [Planctomycetota bacterium]